MAKLQSFMLKDFMEEHKPTNTIEVPIGSIFLQCIAVPQGIIAIYQVSTVDTGTRRIDKFKVLDNDEDIPENSQFVTIIDAISENADKEQVTILMPIYKLLI